MTEITTRTVTGNGIDHHVATAGADGPAVVLLHGWPHTWFLWRHVMRELAPTHRVIAPDLRGLGRTGTTGDGYDLHTLADDVVSVLDGLGVPTATVVGVDLGAPIAWMTAQRHPARVTHLGVMEALLGRLPGAEEFLAAGPPWWFGFHSVPGLAETVLAGHAAEYVDWFLRTGTHEGRGVPAEARAAFVSAYEDPAVLRAGFAHYRALPANARLVADAARRPLRIPVLALGGAVVGDALRRQLAPITPDLRSEIIPDCGHIIPEDAPAALTRALRDLMASAP